MKVNRILLAAVVALAALGFAACGTDKNPAEEGGNEGNLPEERAPLTAETDFDALISDRITAEEWRVLYTPENHPNFTVKADFGGRINVLQCTTQALFYVEEYGTERESSGYESVEEGKCYSMWFDEEASAWKKREQEYFSEQGYGDLIQYLWMEADGGCALYLYDHFDELTYSEEKKGYYGTDIRCRLDEYDEWTAEELLIKVYDGKIAYIYAVFSEEEAYMPYAEYCFYDIGTTEVVLPKV